MINKIKLDNTAEYPIDIEYEDEERDELPERIDDICEYPELGYYFGCEQCEDCGFLCICRERDRYNTNEDYYMDMARGYDD